MSSDTKSSMKSAKVPKSWPPIARGVLLDAARYYYQKMSEPWPAPDVLMEQAIEWANKELEARQREIYEEASPGWIKRWKSGELDAEMLKWIAATYGSLRGAERGIRAHAVKKTRSRQLDAEISQVLARRRS